MESLARHDHLHAEKLRHSESYRYALCAFLGKNSVIKINKAEDKNPNCNRVSVLHRTTSLQVTAIHR